VTEPEDEKRRIHHEPGHDLHEEHEDPLIRVLHLAIQWAVKVLAVLMVFVIIWGIGDVLYVLVQRLLEPPFLLLRISDILATFGAFLAVLIAIEIFVNITMYRGTSDQSIREICYTQNCAMRDAGCRQWP
jgi:uncharacterized membrane protein (DUF373 family)